MSPRISVLMPVRNGRPYLAAAVDSILAQTFTDFEFIIVDDGSRDGTAEMLAQYARADARVRVLPAQGRGLVSALNQALAAARGEYLARMDADDIALPLRFALQLERLAHCPELVGLGAAVEMIDPEGAPIAVCAMPEEPAELARLLLADKTPGIWHPVAMLRASAVRAVGGYDPRYETAEDRGLWLRLVEAGQLANLPQVLLKYRQHLASVGSARRHEQRRAVRRALRDAHGRRGWRMPRGKFRLPCPPSDARHTWIRHAMRAGNFATAAKHMRSLVRERWWSPRTWLLLVKMAGAQPLWREYAAAPPVPLHVSGAPAKVQS